MSSAIELEGRLLRHHPRDTSLSLRLHELLLSHIQVGHIRIVVLLVVDLHDVPTDHWLQGPVSISKFRQRVLLTDSHSHSHSHHSIAHTNNPTTNRKCTLHDLMSNDNGRKRKRKRKGGGKVIRCEVLLSIYSFSFLRNNNTGPRWTTARPLTMAITMAIIRSKRRESHRLQKIYFDWSILTFLVAASLSAFSHSFFIHSSFIHSITFAHGWLIVSRSPFMIGDVKDDMKVVAEEQKLNTFLVQPPSGSLSSLDPS
jgi:hypothetical protein